MWEIGLSYCYCKIEAGDPLSTAHLHGVPSKRASETGSGHTASVSPDRPRHITHHRGASMFFSALLDRTPVMPLLSDVALRVNLSHGRTGRHPSYHWQTWCCQKREANCGAHVNTAHIGMLFSSTFREESKIKPTDSVFWFAPGII